MGQSIRVVLSLIIVVCTLTATARAGTTVIIQKGDAAPTGPGSFTSFTQTVHLNDAGQVAFYGSLTGPGVDTSNNVGIYRGDGVTPVVQIIRSGLPVPVGPGTIHPSDLFALNNTGQVSFHAFLSGVGVGTNNQIGIYRGDGATLLQVARTGQATPSGPGNITGIDSTILLLNDLGQTGFRGFLGGTGVNSTNDVALYRGDGNTIPVQIAREGEASPTSSANFEGFGNRFALNDAGQMAFLGGLIGAGIDITNSTALYRGDGVNTVQIVRKGEASPTGPGHYLNFTSPPTVNDTGHTAFVATLDGSGVTATNNRGVYRSDGINTVQIARGGQAVPNGPGVLTDFSMLLAINNAGQTVFHGSLTGTGVNSSNNSALYRSDGVTTVQVARKGQAVPDGPGTIGGFTTLAFNEAGQVAFIVSLTGPGIDANNNIGIYLYDDTLGLVAVARRGDALLGSTIMDAGITTTSLNNLGQVAYWFRLADGNSGIALFTIPEPGSAAILILSGLWLMRRRSGSSMA